MVQSWLTTISTSQVQAILLPQPPELLRFRLSSPRPANFVLLVKRGFLHVGQAGLECPTSGDLTTSDSQCAGITGVSNRIWLINFFFKDRMSLCCPGWTAVIQLKLIADLNSWAQVILLLQPPEKLGLQVRIAASS